MDGDAYAAFRTAHDKLVDKKMSTSNEDLQGIYSKARGYIARLAMILDCLEQAVQVYVTIYKLCIHATTITNWYTCTHCILCTYIYISVIIITCIHSSNIDTSTCIHACFNVIIIGLIPMVYFYQNIIGSCSRGYHQSRQLSEGDHKGHSFVTRRLDIIYICMRARCAYIYIP